MSGSKLTTMTLEEMRAACARGESQTDWARVRSAILRGEDFTWMKTFILIYFLY